MRSRKETSVSLVHLRPCGERIALQKVVTETIASFPPCGETLCVPPRKQTFPWFISGRAANAMRSDKETNVSLFDPRPCGEHYTFLQGNERFIGSSPAVRGTLCFLARKRMFHWFIPAQRVTMPSPARNGGVAPHDKTPHRFQPRRPHATPAPRGQTMNPARPPGATRRARPSAVRPTAAAVSCVLPPIIGATGGNHTAIDHTAIDVD